MKKREIKETREVVVKTEFVAADGKVFMNEDECIKYENTCRCVIMSEYKSLVVGYISEYEMVNCGCEDYGYDLITLIDTSSVEIVNKALKFWNKSAKLVGTNEIGSTIMVAREYDGSLTGYHTNIDIYINDIKNNYMRKLNKENN